MTHPTNAGRPRALREAAGPPRGPVRRPRTLRALLVLVAGSLLLSGCDFDIYELPLPGGTDTGDDPIVVTAKFADVLDLVPQSNVKVNDVNVGKVTDIQLDGYTADVTLELRNDVQLPDNSLAELRQTSLLGEKFVSLEPPATGGTGTLATGDVIGLDQTGRNPEVEEVLGALSLLLNGGGVAQMKTIASEVNNALEGREGSARSVLTQIDTFVRSLDSRKQDIVAAIESLNRLALQVRRQQGSIDNALEQLPSALLSLDRQRGDLVRMLQALNRLGDVGVRVIQRSKATTIESFRQLQPVLTQLAASGDNFVKAFNVFLTYPFVDEVVGRDPQVARNLNMGDYTNLSVELDLDFSAGGSLNPSCIPLSQIPDDGPLPPIEDLCPQAADVVTKCLNSPSLKNCRGLPGAVINRACKRSPVPLPGLCSRRGGGGGLLPGGGRLPGGDKLPDLPQLPGGVLRSGFGPTARAPARGPTMGQLMEAFDPALVTLLVPGMVIR